MSEWPHAPVHQLSEAGAYIVTAGTYRKEHFFRSRERLDLLQSQLLALAKSYGWRLQAWAVFSNHYHFVASSPDDAGSLAALLRHLHSTTSATVNRDDDAPGRRVWFNYWDSHITHYGSYLARLRYVNENPAHHGLVHAAIQYPWCSARWFDESASAVLARTISRIKIDRVTIRDDFDVLHVD